MQKFRQMKSQQAFSRPFISQKTSTADSNARLVLSKLSAINHASASGSTKLVERDTQLLLNKASQKMKSLNYELYKVLNTEDERAKGMDSDKFHQNISTSPNEWTQIDVYQPNESIRCKIDVNELQLPVRIYLSTRQS